MVMLKNKAFLRACVFLMAVFMVVMSAVSPVVALNKDEYNRYAQNSIYFYDPDGDCIPREGGGGGGEGGGEGKILPGNSRIEKIWNYIAKHAPGGISDKPEIIAGILGNMQQESGFDPFIRNNGGCLGLIQWCPLHISFHSQMKSKGYNKYYHKTGTQPVTNDESIIDAAIEFELDFLFNSGDWQSFLNGINAPQNKTGASGARAYADLFLIKVERGVGGSGTIEDPGVRAIAPSKRYQDAEKRRDYAEEIFNKYGGGGTGGGGEEGEEEDEEDEDLPYCDDDDDDDDDDDGSEEPEAGNLASYVKAWVWPTYRKGTLRTSDYAKYMDNEATYTGATCADGAKGVDCGAFVSNIIRASGWDSNYPLGPTSTQSSWLANNWKKIEDIKSLKLGDVGIKPGHVILYIGDIAGFGSKTASASDCRGPNRRAPSVGSPNENLNQYTWYRKK